MKNILYISFFLSAFALLSFSDAAAKKEVVLTVEVSNCAQVDSLFVFEFDGVLFKQLQAAAKDEAGNFVFKMPKTEPRFYYIGLGGNNIKPIIIGTEKEMTVKSDCQKFSQTTFPNSPINESYTQIKGEINQQKQELNVLVKEYQRSFNRADVLKKTKMKMKTLDDKRKTYLDSLKKVNPYFGEVAALNTYLSFQNNQGEYENEIDYFAKEYFQFADWNKESYNYNPWVYEGLKSYTTTLSSINLLPEKQKEYLDAVLAKIPAEKRTYKLAMGGVLSGLLAKNQPNYIAYGKAFIEKYGEKDPTAAAQINKEIKRLSAFSVGGEAPDFTMNTPEGEAMKLSDHRGKVVLVDFWASWCGPCRRENPNVVKMYHKYKDKGFDILSVSLDKSKDRWLGAIKKDNMTWHHVSDLKGWQNEAAKLYGVRSIPETILLDQDGNIIARKLRGPMLEAKLKEVFGE